jgi:hypothetical protein
MRASTPFDVDITSSWNASLFELRLNVQRFSCDGERSLSEAGSSIVILLSRSVAFKKCNVLRAGPLNQRTSLASPSRGSTPTIVGKLPSHSHIGSPDLSQSRLVVRATTGINTCFGVIAMSWMIPRYGDCNHTSLTTCPCGLIV